MKSSNVLFVIFLSLNLLTISLVVNNVVTAPTAYSAPYGSPNQYASPQSDQSTSASQQRSAAHGSLSNDQSTSASQQRSAALGSAQTSLQQTSLGLSSNIKVNILKDTAEFHAKGWDPNGKATTFLISESIINPNKSVVLINTVQSNFVVCSVDWLTTGYFEVNCNNPPADGAELHYIVFNGKSPVMSAEQQSTGNKNVLSRTNGTQASFAELPRELTADPNSYAKSINATSTSAHTGGNNTNTSTNATSTSPPNK